MNKTTSKVLLCGLFCSFSAFAAYHEINFDLTNLKVLKNKSDGLLNLNSQYKLTSLEGQPKLPYESMIVDGTPKSIQVIVDRGDKITLKGIPTLGEKEKCRCLPEEKKLVEMNLKSYESDIQIKKEYLGKFRGVAKTKISIIPATVSKSLNQTEVYPHLRAEILADDNQIQDVASYDYLIISPENLLSSLQDFVTFKFKNGHTLKVKSLEEIGTTKEQIKDFIKAEYKTNKFKYVLFVGTESMIPTFKVKTEFSAQTSSDYPYFLMDNADIIPDIYSGRLVATSAEEVLNQTKKWMDYEEKISPSTQFLRAIGIASNEGESPSDQDYILRMKQEVAGNVGLNFSYFYQDDPTSNTAGINKALNLGASWMVYIGHGSGTSWASTNQSYSNQSILALNNANVVKPVIIDVSCTNGPLKKGYFGETWMNAKKDGSPIGASMYLGGTVNISWHPPAIMATGMIKEKFAKNLSEFGEIYIAGQMYLMNNHSNLEEVKDNLEWYHLFGDPSAPIHFE